RRRSRPRSGRRPRAHRYPRTRVDVRWRGGGRSAQRRRVRRTCPVALRGEPMIRVLLADDQALVRHGFGMILRAEQGIEVVGEAGDGAEAVTIAAEVEPDVVLMDVRMPTLDGIEATRRIVSAPDSPRVLVLTTFDNDEIVMGALRAGAS